VLRTPVLLIIFNRPDTAQQVFDAIRQTQPRQLFVAADGPREDKDVEAEKCQRTREIVKQVDWDCELRTLFQEKNLGCGLGPATAITWFFDNVEEGIILEDDCLPHPDFFVFCETLLDYYRDDEKIMEISGDNFQRGLKRGNASYYFSAYPHGGGWATWRRAWKRFDYGLVPPDEAKHVWDHQWLISIKKNNGLTVVPNVNLVSNIGYSIEATHTTGPSIYANLPTKSLVFPLTHPKKIAPNKAADRYDSPIRGEPTIIGVMILRISKILPPKMRKALRYIRLHGRLG